MYNLLENPQGIILKIWYKEKMFSLCISSLIKYEMWSNQGSVKRGKLFGEFKWVTQGIIGCEFCELVSRSEGEKVWLIG